MEELIKVKTEIYRRLEELFTTAVVDEMAGDMAAYEKKLNVIAKIADALGMKSEIKKVSIQLKNVE
jgi:hypothetical protein